MVRLILLLALFPTAAAVAQPFVGNEVLSDPLPRLASPLVSAAPAVALARDKTGAAIAWLMPSGGFDHVHVARLDATGHVTGSVHVLATLDPDVDAAGPSMAALPGGHGFTVAWSERPSGTMSMVAAFSRLDAALNAAAPQLLTRTSEAPVVRSGDSTWIAAGSYVFSFDADGARTGLFYGPSASDMTLTGNLPQIVNGVKVTTNGSFTCPVTLHCGPVAGGPFHGACPEQCRVYDNITYTSLMQFQALYSTTAAQSFPFNTEAKPAIGSDGNGVVIVWLRGSQADGGDVALARLEAAAFPTFADAVRAPGIIGHWNADQGVTRPDVASDGEHLVIVWRNRGEGGDHDIAGASIDREGQVTALSIATSPAEERDPSVLALGEGRFVVAYETIANGQRRIAGRIVTFGSRRRPV
ncbi:MAG: hypothetical protein JWO56_1915 [Acidobacteria bacterium]|nr:hypothetical protein [Acidobacteriota bacterium]